MYVYRLEFKDTGKGIYRDDKFHPNKIMEFTKFYIENHEYYMVGDILACEFHDDYMKSHPAACDDVEIRHHFSLRDIGNSSWRFGFKDTDQLLNWFPIIGLKNLAKYCSEENQNVVISVYKVGRAHSSRHQVIFDVNDSEKCDEFSIEEFVQLVK